MKLNRKMPLFITPRISHFSDFNFLKYPRTLSACLLLLSVAVPSTFLFSRVEAKVTIDGDAVEQRIPDAITPDGDYLLAKRSSCHARFFANGITTEWIELGDVGGFLSFENKKGKCLQKAKDYVSQLNFSTFGFNGQQICDNGGYVEVYADTDVDGKVNSRDGSVTSNLKANCVSDCKLNYVP